MVVNAHPPAMPSLQLFRNALHVRVYIYSSSKSPLRLSFSRSSARSQAHSPSLLADASQLAAFHPSASFSLGERLS